MAEAQQHDSDRWAHMNESIDLLFAQMGDIGRAQEEMKVTQEFVTKALE
jgi:hypothetical protein